VAERSSAPKRKPAHQTAKRPDDKDPEFEPWLDSRLKSIYDAVLKEPLPDEILKLLNTPKRD
jgi:hypothetical protein